MVLGSVITLLATPKSGAEVRGQIKDLVNREARKVRDKYHEVEEMCIRDTDTGRGRGGEPAQQQVLLPCFGVAPVDGREDVYKRQGGKRAVMPLTYPIGRWIWNSATAAAHGKAT